MQQVGQIGQDDLNRLLEFYDMQQQKLGQGSQGVVWLCRDDRNGYHFALKAILNQLMQVQFSRQLQASLRNEISIQLQLYEQFNVQCVTQIYSKSIQDIWMAMKYCNRHTLLDYLRFTIPLREDTIKWICYQILTGISQIHQNNIVHLDIKPNNILLHATIQFEFQLSDQPNDNINNIVHYLKQLCVGNNAQLLNYHVNPDNVSAIINRGPLNYMEQEYLECRWLGRQFNRDIAELCLRQLHSQSQGQLNRINVNSLSVSKSHRVFIGDFGLSTNINNPVIIGNGTRHFRAPEFINYTNPISYNFRKCDAFSFGILLFWMLYIHPPQYQYDEEGQYNLYRQSLQMDGRPLCMIALQLIDHNPEQRRQIDEQLIAMFNQPYTEDIRLEIENRYQMLQTQNVFNN